MKNFFLIIVLLLCDNFNLFSQEPIIAYCFKVFDKNNNEINDTNKIYQFKSLSLKGYPETLNDTVLYSYWDYCPPTCHWMIIQEFKNIRNYLWLQIIENNNKDTMNIFLKKSDRYSFYGDPENDPNRFDGKVVQVDSISFQKGNFIIKARPKFNDWKNLNSNKNIKKLEGRIEDYLKKNFDQYGNKKK
jgi:hypothetical protein